MADVWIEPGDFGGWSGLKLHLGAVGDVTADFNYLPFLAAVVPAAVR